MRLSSTALPRVVQLMPSVAPAARVTIVLEALARLERLQREMSRLRPRDQDYESKRRALRTAIRELRQTIAANEDLEAHK